MKIDFKVARTRQFDELQKSGFDVGDGIGDKAQNAIGGSDDVGGWGIA